MYDSPTHVRRRRRAASDDVNIITNGLLLTPEVVDRDAPYGSTASRSRSTAIATPTTACGHSAAAGTFDRIVDNIRKVAGRCRIAIGGNFDETSVDSYPALLDFLAAQEFADKLVKVNFKPVVRTEAEAERLHPADSSRRQERNTHLNGTCMTSAARRRRPATTAISWTTRWRSSARRPAPGFRRRWRSQRPVPRAQAARAHDRSRRIALRVPRIHGPAAMSTGTSTTGRILASNRRGKVRSTVALVGVRRLRVSFQYVPVAALPHRSHNLAT
jgi:hypothetical protein